MSRRKRTAGTLCLLVMLALGAAPSSPRAADPEVYRSYHDVMDALKREIGALLVSVLEGDLPAVVKAADEVLEQPHPPIAEQNRVLASLGIDAGPFRQLEDRIRLDAESLETAARRGDLLQSTERFQDLIGTCFRCHVRYRAAVREALRANGGPAR